MGSTFEFGFIRLSCGHEFALDEDQCVVDADELIMTVRGTGWGPVGAKAVLTPYALYVDDYYDNELVLDDYCVQEYEDLEFDSYSSIEDFEWDDDPICICPQCGSETNLRGVGIHLAGTHDEGEVEELSSYVEGDNLASFFSDLIERSG